MREVRTIEVLNMSRNAHGCRFVAVLAILFFLSSAVLKAQSPALQRMESTWHRANAAMQKGDAKGAKVLFQKLVGISPDDPGLLYHLAQAQALAGDSSEALVNLERVVELGFGLQIGHDADFKPLWPSPRFLELRRKVRILEKPVINSQVALTIPERDLIPEGMAYDSKRDVFYVSSQHKRKIVVIDRAGRVRDLISPAQNGIWEVLGMKVDAPRNTLVVCSEVDDPWMEGFTKNDVGKSGVFVFDLPTGHLVHKYLPPPGMHLFNDLVIAHNGDVYVTDSDEGTVYKIDQQLSHIERLTQAVFLYPNGIALSPDERLLYIAEVRGIDVLNLQTGKLHPLPHPRNATLVGIDGLYFHRGNLVAVQNGVEPNRVVAFHLDGTGTAVESTKVLEWRSPFMTSPTTGAFAGDTFYFLGNSQSQASYPDGKLWPLYRLQPVHILKLRSPNT